MCRLMPGLSFAPEEPMVIGRSAERVSNGREPMTRKNFLTSMAGAAAALHAQSNKKRNIVLIVADDHRWDMLGSMGHPWLQTPHLDRLAKGGALFENAFVTTAECSASRASLVSGLYAHSHGILDISTPQPSGFRTFPQL